MAAQCYDTIVVWNAARTGYSYKDNNNKWVHNDTTSNWKEIGDEIYKLQGAPPYARSTKSR
ncbi:uncharacterized protein N7518_000237 [Penicillium psychrosexuale]|uniref:uncharacterized protein n=1 Tax=Penicillium psychrosexuale TaxID=1002107 RepID=UPI0025458043|nr:uncharacterized protein N7518_000237 [Penicillium psychrosexuale]KAJ5803934.1 hypothetical protein N7518_000237 [Penicillium psychrosexuale]